MSHFTIIVSINNSTVVDKSVLLSNCMALNKFIALTTMAPKNFRALDNSISTNKCKDLNNSTMSDNYMGLS